MREQFLPHLTATGERAYLGVDFARKRDKSVFVVAQLDNDMTRKCNILELSDCPYDAQLAAAAEIVAHCDRFGSEGFGVAMLDAGSNGEWLAEALSQKIGWRRVEAVKPSLSWYRENMPYAKSAFQDGTVLIPRDKDIIDDLLTVELQDGVAQVPKRRTTGADGLQRHADAAVAIVFALSASRRTPPSARDVASGDHPRGNSFFGFGGGDFNRGGYL